MDTTRLAAYKTNLDFYNGSQWQQTSRNSQLVFNYAKVTIDKVTSFLTQGLGFACYPDATNPMNPTNSLNSMNSLNARVRTAEQVLRQACDQNNLQQLDYETEINAAVLGEACYTVIWDTEDKRVRITAPDVSGIFAWWLGDDTSRVWRVASRCTLTKDEVEMLYSDVIASASPSVILGIYAENVVIWMLIRSCMRLPRRPLFPFSVTLVSSELPGTSRIEFSCS
jgi:hypothetical protein